MTLRKVQNNHVEQNASCPSCGAKGKPVKPITIKRMLTDEAKSRVSRWDGFLFCPTPTCEIAYFHTGTNERLLCGDVRVRIGQKGVEGPHPLCYCFNHTVEEIEAEVAQRGTSRIPENIAQQCRLGLARCEETNPQGACCLGNVQKALKMAQAGHGDNPAIAPVADPDTADHAVDCCAKEKAKED